MGKFTDNELRYDEWCHNLIFNYHIFESAGHPLFNDDAEIGGNFVDRLKKLIDYVNLKFDDSKLEYQGVLTLKNINKKYDVFVYKPITIALNKLGFKDVINAKNFSVKITVVNVVEDCITSEDLKYLSKAGSGQFNFSKGDYIHNKQFVSYGNGAKIEITCYAINGKLIPSTFLETFLHEYLHLYDAYNRIKRGTNYNDIDDSNMIGEFRDVILNFTQLSNNERNCLSTLAYRLFNGEDNALIGNLFGYLVSHKINTYADYIMHKDDILECVSYNNLKESYEVIKNIPAEIFKMLMKSSTAFNKKKKFDENGKYKIIHPVIKNEDPEAVKRRFLNMCENKINKIYSKTIKFVGRYIQLIRNYNMDIVNTIVKY